VADVLVPTPIGVGPAYHPPPAVHAPCTAAPLAGLHRVHVELFAHGRVVIVPAGIGLRGARRTLGRIVAARCRAGAWTLDPTGVVRLERQTTLGAVFAVWGQPLGPARLLGFRGEVRVFRNGHRMPGDPRALALRDRDQVVLEIGRYVPPHVRYRFPPH